MPIVHSNVTYILNSPLKESEMKKVFFLFALAWFTATTIKAEDYGYIVFQQSSGTEQSVDAMGLKITFLNGQLIATPKTGDPLSLSLADMAAMRFSVNGATAIRGISAAAGVSVNDGSIVVSLGANSWAKVFTPSGVAVAQFSTADTGRTFATRALQGGVYIVKTNNTTTKILIK